MSASFMQDEQVPLPAEAVLDIIRDETKCLRRHLGLGESPEMPPGTPPACAPMFFLERAPNSRTGAKCQLPYCPDRIRPDEYRIALNPGMNVSSRYSSQNSDFYHVACFERIADFSQSEFNKRIQPVTRRFFHFRNLKASQILDGDYLCDGGAERLILEWKVRRGRLLDKRDGVEEEQEAMHPGLHNLLYRAGSSTFDPQSIPDMSRHEYFLLCSRLAPCESDGQGDAQEWNLFDSYVNVDDNEESLYDRRSLSDMLEHWKRDVVLATSPDRTLTDAESRSKAQLGEKAIKAINRLSTVPMPDLQSAFLG